MRVEPLGDHDGLELRAGYTVEAGALTADDIAAKDFRDGDREMDSLIVIGITGLRELRAASPRSRMDRFAASKLGWQARAA